METNHQIQIGVCYAESLFMDEIDFSENLFKYLITPLLNNEGDVCRGAHISVVGEESIVSVFYNQLGWADVGYNYLKLAICNMKTDYTLMQSLADKRKKNNTWSLRS